jgi:hypothetical protein
MYRLRADTTMCWSVFSSQSQWRAAHLTDIGIETQTPIIVRAQRDGFARRNQRLCRAPNKQAGGGNSREMFTVGAITVKRR